MDAKVISLDKQLLRASTHKRLVELSAYISELSMYLLPGTRSSHELICETADMVNELEKVAYGCWGHERRARMFFVRAVEYQHEYIRKYVKETLPALIALGWTEADARTPLECVTKAPGESVKVCFAVHFPEYAEPLRIDRCEAAFRAWTRKGPTRRGELPKWETLNIALMDAGLALKDRRSSGSKHPLEEQWLEWRSKFHAANG